MSILYRDILRGFKEIGALEGNKELYNKADRYLKEYYEGERKMRTSKTCTFTGHRPERLTISEVKVTEWLKKNIEEAINSGYINFITGMQRGVDLWAAEEVLRQKATHPDIRLIAAVAFKGMENEWDESWQERFNKVLATANERHIISPFPGRKAFFARNEWMVDRSSLLLAVYNNAPGGTQKTIEYAQQKGLKIEILQ